MGPVFEYVPILGGSAAKLRVVAVEGVSTKHGDTKTDRGRLYAKVTKPSNYQVDLYADVARTAPKRVLTGSGTSLGEYFDLTAVNTSGLSGRAVIDSYSADDSTAVLIVSFATDQDVLVNSTYCAQLPFYDGTYGLGYFHAQAMRQILTADLPRAVPHLFGGIGLAAFVPTSATSSMPALTKIANPDQLRVAQASLVKALSAEQSEHLEEWALLAKAARERYNLAMTALAEANTEDEDEGEAEESNVSVSQSIFGRG